jgi:hypothetical protein
MSGVAMPEFAVMPGAEGKHAQLPPLPEGVPNVDMWGYTLIEFGQFKNASMSYQELVDSTEDRAVSYVKCCRSRGRSTTGQLKDLCDFLARHFAELEEESGHEKVQLFRFWLQSRTSVLFPFGSEWISLRFQRWKRASKNFSFRI